MRKLTTYCMVFIGAIGTAPVRADTTHVDIDRIPVCYNFGCNTRDTIGITSGEWAQVVNWFQPRATNAAEEREQIRHALGWLEVVVGRYTPTHRDKGQNNFKDTSFGQMDCIDESINTTTYLRLLERYRLLKFHRVLDRAYRRTMWDQHWAGQIEEFSTGERWIVDSWFQDHGVLPYVQQTKQWEDIPFFFSSYIDNSPDEPSF